MPKKILVVEDNDMNRRLITFILKPHGYEVIEAINGDEGIKMARKYKPDLILMDIQMPVLNGCIAAEMLKNNPDTKCIGIVALTSFAMKGDKERIMEAGFDDYIAKPIDTRILSETVEKLLNL